MQRYKENLTFQKINVPFIKKSMWYRNIFSYDNVYMCCEGGIEYFYDKTGKYLTQTYLPPNPDNMKPVKWYNKSSIIIENTPSFTIGEEYTCQVQFTSQGLLYGFGTYRWHTCIHTGQKLYSNTNFDYIFVPYEDE